MTSKRQMVKMETEREIAPRGAQKEFPFLIAAIAILVVVGLLVVLGLAMRNSANKSLVPGENIPDFSFTSYSGETFKSRNYSEKSSWSISGLRGVISCEDEGEALEQVWQELKDSGEVVFWVSITSIPKKKPLHSWRIRRHLCQRTGPGFTDFANLQSRGGAGDLHHR